MCPPPLLFSREKCKPLQSNRQMASIVDKWLAFPSRFRNKVEAMDAQGVARRPLFRHEGAREGVGQAAACCHAAPGILLLVVVVPRGVDGDGLARFTHALCFAKPERGGDFLLASTLQEIREDGHARTTVFSSGQGALSTPRHSRYSLCMFIPASMLLSHHHTGFTCCLRPSR